MTIKTAISLDQGLFAEAEAMAAARKWSRSRLFGAALREYLRRQRNRETLEQLNRVYADAPGAEVADVARVARKRSHRRLVEGSW